MSSDPNVDVGSERQSLLRGAAAGEQHAGDLASEEDLATSPREPWSSPRASLFKLGAGMLDFWISGLAMTAVGTLLPRIEEQYDLRDDIASFIFAAVVTGYLAATALAQMIVLRMGLRGATLISPASRLLASVLLALRLPFPAVLLAYSLFGFGTGLTDTAFNAWAAGSNRPNIVQGFLHASFAVGCVLGPIGVAEMLKRYSWSHFYVAMALLSLLELFVSGRAFRDARSSTPQSPASLVLVDQKRSLFRNRAVQLCIIFYIVYQGVEASLTDWLVIYLRRTRDASTSTASMATSFLWVGIAAGRYTLGPITERFGLRAAVTAYILSAILFQIILMFITNITAFLALMAAIGFSISTVFPSGIVLLVNNAGVPVEKQTAVVAVAIAAGQVGAAIAPVGIGFLSARVGMGRFLDIVLGFSIAMLLAWIALSWKRKEEAQDSALSRQPRSAYQDES